MNLFEVEYDRRAYGIARGALDDAEAEMDKIWGNKWREEMLPDSVPMTPSDEKPSVFSRARHRARELLVGDRLGAFSPLGGIGLFTNSNAIALTNNFALPAQGMMDRFWPDEGVAQFAVGSTLLLTVAMVIVSYVGARQAKKQAIHTAIYHMRQLGMNQEEILQTLSKRSAGYWKGFFAPDVDGIQLEYMPMIERVGLPAVMELWESLTGDARRAIFHYGLEEVMNEIQTRQDLMDPDRLLRGMIQAERRLPSVVEDMEMGNYDPNEQGRALLIKEIEQLRRRIQAQNPTKGGESDPPQTSMNSFAGSLVTSLAISTGNEAVAPVHLVTTIAQFVLILSASFVVQRSRKDASNLIKAAA